MTNDELDRVLDIVDEAILDSTGSITLSQRVRDIVATASGEMVDVSARPAPAATAPLVGSR
jgi:hypothetical protein